MILIAGYVTAPLLVWWLYPLAFLSVRDLTDRVIPRELSRVKKATLLASWQWPYARTPWGLGRVLDAWVDKHRQTAQERFENMLTVKTRIDDKLESKGLVDLPLEINDKLEEGPAPELFRPQFEKESLRLLIHGVGGTGKTTLACLLASWALEPRGRARLTAHPMLPILIEHELPAESNPLRGAIRQGLSDLVGLREPVTDELLDDLLRERRLLVIIDHLSEMSQKTREAARADQRDLRINALVITSRATNELQEFVTDRVETVQIDQEHLSRFLESYMNRRGKRDLLTDTDYEEARRRLANMLGRPDRKIPVLFPKLYIDRLCAVREGGDGASMPLSVPELMAYYVVEQNRNLVVADRLPDQVVDRCSRAAGWECVRKEFRSLYAEEGDILAALESEPSPKDALDYLIDRLGILRRDELTGRVRFELDTLAEYLAARNRVEKYGSNAAKWTDFLGQADEAAKRFPLANTQSFLYAVWDCIVSPREQALQPGLDGPRLVPEDIVAKLGERTGLDEASLRHIENRKFRNLIESMTAKVVLLLGRFSPERKVILDKLWDSLHRLGYIPVIFEFDPPTDRDRTETATLLAHMSRFLVADITAARSVPQELQAIVPTLSIPVLLILDGREGTGPYALAPDFAKYGWVLPIFKYHDENHLISSLKEKLVDPAEEWLRGWGPAQRQRGLATQRT
jgi:SpoVK/Ycf46/Vps4 family AAA+-type ATPase